MDKRVALALFGYTVSNPTEVTYQCISFLGTSTTLPWPLHPSRLTAALQDILGTVCFTQDLTKCFGIKLSNFAQHINRYTPRKPREVKQLCIFTGTRSQHMRWLPNRDCKTEIVVSPFFPFHIRFLRAESCSLPWKRTVLSEQKQEMKVCLSFSVYLLFAITASLIQFFSSSAKLPITI